MMITIVVASIVLTMIILIKDVRLTRKHDGAQRQYLSNNDNDSDYSDSVN